MQRKSLKYGKSYYITLGCFLLIIVIMGSISLGVSLFALHQQEAEADRVTETLVRQSRDLLCEDMNQSSVPEIYQQLETAFPLTTMNDSELTQILKELSVNENYPTSCFYLYYPESGKHLGERQHEEELRLAAAAIDSTTIPQESVSGGLIFINPDGEEPFSVRWFFPTGDSCFMMITYGKPGVQGIESLMEILRDPELYFYDSYGNVVPAADSSGKFSHVMDYYSLGSAPDGSGKFTMDGIPYTYSYATLADSGSRFAVISRDEIAQTRNSTFLFILVTLCSAILIGVALSFLLTRRLYRPMETLLRQLPVQENSEIPDEYRLLHTTLQDMGDTLSLQKKLLTSSQLRQIMHGYVIDRDSEDEHFFFDSEAYILAELLLDEMAGKESLQSRGPQEIATALDERVSGLLEDYGCEFLSVWDSGRLLYLVKILPDGRSDIVTLFDNVRSVLETTDGYLISVYLSSAHKGREQLPIAYREVQGVREYAEQMEKYNAVFPFEKYTAQILSYSFKKADQEALDQLTELLTGGQTSQLLAAFDRIAGMETAEETSEFEAASGQRSGGKPISLIEQRMVLRTLQGTILSALLELSESKTVSRELLMTATAKMDSVNSLAEVRKLLKEISDQIGPAAEESGGEDARFEQIDQYMQQYYRDPNFNAHQLAEAFGTCPSNITRLFKKYKNSGFLEYLHLLRLKQAKRLLTETNYSVSDVAILVGYSNALTMTRAFKRYLGTTPGAYRLDSRNTDDVLSSGS